jgi:hypothetical protein
MSKITKLVNAGVLEALSLIGDIVEHTSGDHTKATIALAVIKSIVESVKAAHAREITPEEMKERVNDSLQQLQDSIEQNRKDALAELDKKFPVTSAPATDTAPE